MSDFRAEKWGGRCCIKTGSCTARSTRPAPIPALFNTAYVQKECSGKEFFPLSPSFDKGEITMANNNRMQPSPRYR